MFGVGKKTDLPTAADALPGRSVPIAVPEKHHVNGNPIKGPYPANMAIALFGMGCFWGVERLFWQQEGVFSTAVGYLGGFTPHPLYEEVCTGATGHNEVVQVVFDPAEISFVQLLALFWNSHDPTQGMRQGNDVGTQYRSGIYTIDEAQQKQALISRDQFQQQLSTLGRGTITTEILPSSEYYFAEDYHQQYLSKNPGGYCNLQGTGVLYSGESV